MGVPDPIERLDGTTIDTRFRLERFVARGGYGAVYRGVHNALGCPVAVKVLAVPEALREAERERFFGAFEHEARIVATLRHPSIVRVLDFGVTSVGEVPHPFIVLEWLDGETLDARLRAEGERARSPREAMALLRPVLDAIAAAHESGVAHRDLKPANVMVSTSRRGDASAKVLDFGVAKVFSPDEAPSNWSERTADPHAAFSLSHAAPEQVARLRTGPWTDVHALALLVVEVLLGRRAYAGETTIALYASISAMQRPTPGRFFVDVGPWEPVLARALSLTPGDRHPDAAALLADLDRTLAAAQAAWEPRPAPTPAETVAPTPTPASAPPRAMPSWRLRAVGVAVLATLGAVALAGTRGRASTPATSSHVGAASSHDLPTQPLPPRAMEPREPLSAAPSEPPAVVRAETSPARPALRAAPGRAMRRARPNAQDGGIDDDFVIE